MVTELRKQPGRDFAEVDVGTFEAVLLRVIAKEHGSAAAIECMSTYSTAVKFGVGAWSMTRLSCRLSKCLLPDSECC
jgi:hypothetical protein